MIPCTGLDIIQSCYSFVFVDVLNSKALCKI